MAARQIKIQFISDMAPYYSNELSESQLRYYVNRIEDEKNFFHFDGGYFIGIREKVPVANCLINKNAVELIEII